MANAGSSGVDLNTLTGWSRHTNFGTQSIAVSGSNRAYSNSASARNMYLNSWTPPTADYSVMTTLFYASSLAGTQFGIAGRMSSVATTCYFGYWDDGTTELVLGKFVAGTYTTLGFLTQAITVSTSHTLQLTMLGQNIRLQFDGVTIVSVTDASISAAGQAGLTCQGAMGSAGGMQGGAFYACSSNVGSNFHCHF
jgi:hypothetical protein